MVVLTSIMEDGDPSSNDDTPDRQAFWNPFAGMKPDCECRMHIVPPVMMTKTLFSGTRLWARVLFSRARIVTKRPTCRRWEGLGMEEIQGTGNIRWQQIETKGTS